MSGKYKKTRKYLNYVEHLLILVLTVIGCISISAFSSLVAINCRYYEFCSWNKHLRNHFNRFIY